MPCYYPVDGWRSAKANENGKYEIVFSKEGAQLDDPVKLACGKCVGCRLDRSREWAFRCMAEAKFHEENCFLTLTFNEEHLPYPPSIDVRDLQLFMKRLRKKYPEKKIRFYACGEYGDEKHATGIANVGRPHYHLIVFGHDFSDKEIFEKKDVGNIYTSEELADLWAFGHSTTADVTFETAAYVARYCVKKIGGEMAESHYQWIDLHTGESHQLTPEFSTQSNRPGIGREWFETYKSDLEKGYVTQDGNTLSVPSYFDKLLKAEGNLRYMRNVEKRSQAIDSLDLEYSSPRLKDKEQVKLNRTRILKRK